MRPAPPAAEETTRHVRPLTTTVKRLTASRRGRVIVAVTAVVGILAGVKVVLSFGPVGTGMVAGPLVAAFLVWLARRAGLSWDDLGLSRRTLRRGAAWAALSVVVVAAVLLVGISLPAFHSIFLNADYRMDLGSALVVALLVVPLSTILLEEVAFRGVLFGLLRRHQSITWAFGFSSLLFGLWHVAPSLPATGFAGIAAVVVVTALLGLLLCEVRRRSGSLLAAMAGHWAANGMGVVLAALLWSWT